MNKMLSVVVPVYNVERYLDECMESLLAQTYSPIEFILVNDGSTDGSAVICDRYAALDERVRVFHKENGGLSSARNYGINKSVGEYITFVDSDDSLGSAFAYEDCMTYFTQETEISIVQYGLRTYIDEGDIVNDFNLGGALRDGYMVMTRQEVIKDFKNNRTRLVDEIVCCKIFQRKLLLSLDEKCEIFPDKKLHEDTIFFVSLLYGQDEFKICVIPQVYYNYRLGRVGAITSSVTERHVVDLVTSLWDIVLEQEKRKSRSELVELYWILLFFLIEKYLSLYMLSKDCRWVLSSTRDVFKGLRKRIFSFYHEIPSIKYIVYLFFPKVLDVNRWLGRW